MNARKALQQLLVRFIMDDKFLIFVLLAMLLLSASGHS